MRFKFPLFLLIVLLMIAPSLPAYAASSTFITSGTTSSKEVAFTFDDGSDGTNIGTILSTLRKENVRSTFFLTGKGAENHPSSIRSIAAAGHEIANHSYSHPDFTTLSYSQIRGELFRTEDILESITGQPPAPLFRAPFGSVNPRVLEVVGEAGYPHTIHWDIDTLDWRGLSATEVYNRIMNNVKPGSIVLMHTGAGASGTPGAIARAIPALKSQGYTFVTISDLLNETQGITHLVQAGDTLYSLAKRYGTTVDALVSANGITDVTDIQIGDVLIVTSDGTGSGSGGGRYTVKAGDTLYRIAREHNVSLSSLARENGIKDPSYIFVGQVLVIPGTPPATSDTYTVKAGDTLYRIALNHGTTVSRLANTNSISAPYLIHPGQVLTIPD